MNENDVSNPVSQQELLIGEITAALAAESMSAQDALPPELAARVMAARASSASARDAVDVVVPIKPSATPYNSVVLPPPPTASATAVRARRPFATWGGWLASAMLALWLRGPSAPAAAVVSAGVEPKRLPRRLRPRGFVIR